MTGFGSGAAERYTALRYRVRDARSRRLFEVLARHADGRVLDVGGGRFAEAAASHGIAVGEWAVVEPDRAAFAGGTASVSGPAAIVGDGRRLPVADGAADTVLCIQVLEHVFEPMEVLSELVRVTRPGGVIVVMVPQTANVHHVPEHFQNFTRYWLEEAGRRLGLETVEYHALGGAWSSLASRAVLAWATWARVPGYHHPGVRRSAASVLLAPLGWVLTAVVVPVAMLLSVGDLEEEANNHLVVWRRPV